MRADNTAYLIAAASRRHELARSKAIRTVRELDTAGTTVTFESVARAAGVSRSWLYTQPDIRDEVLRLRDLGRRAPATPLPAHRRSSDASLLRRLEATTARNRELAQDNQRLRRRLAQALGQLRAPASGPTPASVPAMKGKLPPVTTGSADHDHPSARGLAEAVVAKKRVARRVTGPGSPGRAGRRT